MGAHPVTSRAHSKAANQGKQPDWDQRTRFADDVQYIKVSDRESPNSFVHCQLNVLVHVCIAGWL